MEARRIRAHHGLCTVFFRGHGYSGEFSRNMEAVIRELEKNPQITVLEETDDICRACPNRKGDQCSSLLKPEDYDGRVLEFCGLEPGAQLSWREFQALVLGRIILAGRRREVCGDCEWDGLCRSLEEEVRADFPETSRFDKESSEGQEA